MNSKTDTLLKCLLTPLSWLYGGVTGLRNFLFDRKILKEEKFDVPIVGIGNLTVGGTGKTPHVEYVVGMLSTTYNIAVLSRGYKRKTRGFIIANSKSTPDMIGDEPLQIYQKFGMRAKVAVCEDRRKGIRELLRIYPHIQMIVLDDSYQHRYVKPKVNVLLMDYNRPVYRDKLLPLGRLRESAHQINRADMVVVTKCPDTLQPLDYLLVKKELNLMPYQKLFFSKFEYGGLLPVFPDESKYHVSLDALGPKDTVLLVSGIAHPRHFVRSFKKYPFKVKVMHFPDHHDFNRRDVARIAEKFKSLKGVHKLIVTTEKDAVRLSHNPYFPRELMQYSFYLPVGVRMVNGSDSEFIEELRRHIDNEPLGL